VNQPNVNEKASTPESRNSISNSDELRLSDQLIQRLVYNRAIALVVDVSFVSSARHLSIDKHVKSRRSPPHCRSHEAGSVAAFSFQPSNRRMQTRVWLGAERINSLLDAVSCGLPAILK
jgi:hypothetical protein